MKEFTVTIGRLLCGKMRKYLERYKFHGTDITWFESSGLLERKFTIKGNEIDKKKMKSFKLGKLVI